MSQLVKKRGKNSDNSEERRPQCLYHTRMDDRCIFVLAGYPFPGHYTQPERLSMLFHIQLYQCNVCIVLNEAKSTKSTYG